MQPQRSKIQDFFLYLFNIICLYVSAVSFLSLLYAIINNYFNDALFDYYSFTNTGAKMAIASLIIFFPLYIWLSAIINKSVLKFPETVNLLIRKILYYFTLFVAGLTIAIDLVILIFNFLDGEISTRFILKVLSVLLVGGVVFGYYLYDLKRNLVVKNNTPRTMAIVVSVLVLIALVWGVIVSGSPMQARKIKFDNQRVNDLSNIQGSVVQYFQNNKVLPSDLKTLSEVSPYYISNLNDPETGVPYEYKILSRNRYEVCATFSTDSNEVGKNQGRLYKMDPWSHRVGRQCFQLAAGEISGMTKPVPMEGI